MTLFELERTANFEELVDYLQQSDNPIVRARAAEIIGGLESAANGPGLPRDTIVDALITAAQSDEDESVRASAIDALDQYGKDALERFIEERSGESFVQRADWKRAELLARVLDSSVPELRMAAATGLGRLGTENVVGPLTDRLADPDPRVRTRAARALARIGSPEAVPALAARLQTDEPAVRIEVAYALADIGTDAALAELATVATDDDEVLRRIAVDALGRFGRVDAVDVLANALSDEAEPVRRTAMFSLVELLSAAPAEASHQVRERIVDELEAATEHEAIQPLIDILDRSDETAQRRNAAWLLGRITVEEYTREAQDVLIETLADDDEMTAKFAATSLALLDGGDLEPRLLALIESDRDEEIRAKALFVLGKIGGDDARQRLSAFVDRTESDRLRKRGFSALSKLGGVGVTGGDRS